MQRGSEPVISFGQEIKQINCQNSLFSSTNSSSTSSVSDTATLTNLGNAFEKLSRGENRSFETSKEYAELADAELKSVRWKISNNSSNSFIINSDASSQSLATSCQEQRTREHWSQEEKKSQLNMLELKTAKLTTKFTITFTRKWYINSFKVRQLSGTVLSIENGRTKIQEMVSVNKEIWDYLMSHKIASTAEYLPVVMNVEVD